MTEPPWYQTAVFYEVPVYAFFDANGDGIGDFAGLTQKLDYLQWLGVDCLWILPFYESPRRDGGYDVSDFRAVWEPFGAVEDVRRFLDEAHARGLRVIADMVVNHTSDQHPWFLEARRPGSPMRDWYVWSDDPTRWPDARVIFVDTHDSNWTWDAEAGSFYWHRFFDHQPDLNFDNPEVREAVKDIVRFWLEAGFDGLRLDAVPYLFERDGTAAWPAPKRFDTSITWMTTGQTDDDPAVEVVVAGADGTVAAVDGRTKQTEWRHDFGKFAAVHAFGDADDDGRAEVYATARDGKLRSIGADDGRVEWATTLTTADVPMMPPPTLGDPDGDGDQELVAAANDGTVAVVAPSTGEVVESYSREQSILTRPRLADLDGDGDDEVLVTYAYGRVVALDYARCDATDDLGCVFG